MYYLLKNNRIIDTNNKTFKALYKGENGITHYSIETPNEKHHHYCLGGGEYENNIYEFDTYSIKTLSVNVYNLIEKGDLVRYLNNIYEIKNVYYIDDGVVDFVTSNCGICFPSWKKFLKGLNAIYKPNSNGDYIKVWEKKDE